MSDSQDNRRVKSQQAKLKAALSGIYGQLVRAQSSWAYLYLPLGPKKNFGPNKRLGTKNLEDQTAYAFSIVMDNTI